MTLAQVKALLIGVLKGWFSNKKILDKFSEEDGVLLYDDAPIEGEQQLTEEQVTMIGKFSESDGKLLYNSKTIECVCPTVTDEEVTAAIAEVIAAIDEDEDDDEEQSPTA